MLIRAETRADESRIRELNLAAFPDSTEANLVELLRSEAHPLISLVAEDAGRISGHICFSPMSSDYGDNSLIMGLAPMAVLPERQRQGIGSALVRAGLDRCAGLGAKAVVVLGHAAYYPRFGFRPAGEFGVTSEYDVPAGVFQVQELAPGFFSGDACTVRYHPAFDTL
jgi:putative acetyltransferase